MAASTDVMVVGAGAIGASVAAHPATLGARVIVLEKERAPAQHQSGRNCGVIRSTVPSVALSDLIRSYAGNRAQLVIARDTCG